MQGIRMIKFLFFIGLMMPITYASTIELEETKSPTGKRVYCGEYGVCILATGAVADASVSISRQFSADLPPITPHITLLQGQFSDAALGTLREALKTFAKEQAPFSITMAAHISKGGGGNTFWDVERSISVWEKLNAMNEELCHRVAHPVGLMQQVKDSLNNETGDKQTIEKWGRDFNIPGANRPHITVSYGSQDEDVIRKVNAGLSQKSFLAGHIHLVKIDYVGNIVEIIEDYKFLGEAQDLGAIGAA